jgi:ABC-type amino acid transport substrate-binding protein
MTQSLMTRRTSLRWLAAAAMAAPAWSQSAAPETALARIRARGTLRVGVYHDMPPFHAGGRGIDVDLAHALAEALGVKAALMPFNADDNMRDDLRNMVWKGHYLGYGPADVLLHVPVDKPLMDDTPQVQVLAPYYRDRVMIARRLDRLPHLETLAPLAGHRVAVPGQTLAGWLLIGADRGAYREQLVTHWKHGAEAAEALRRGDVDAAAGLASELETVLHDDPRFAIAPLPAMQAPRNGWAVGMAVKRDAIDLAQALQQATNDLATDGRLKAAFARAHVEWRAA